MSENRRPEIGEQHLNLASTIPQVFYDVIGRIVPGIILVAAISHVCDISITNGRNLVVGAFESVGGSVVLLIASYMTAAFLGAFWMWACHWRGQGERATDKMRQRIVSCAPILTRSGCPDISFAYDYVQWWNPPAGARMAKLRAEQHFCGVVIVGSVIVVLCAAMCDIIDTVQGRGGESQWPLVVPACLFSVVGSCVFHRHLTDRITKALANLWVIAHRTT